MAQVKRKFISDGAINVAKTDGSFAQQSSLLAEQTARIAADDYLQSEIDALNAGSSGLSDEISARIAADAAEQTARIAADNLEITARMAADAAEVIARNAAIAVEATARDAAIAVETAARIAADAVELTARNAAILVETNRALAAEGVEQTARIAGDATNAAAILVEQTARIAGDNLEITARQAAIAQEVSDRNAAIAVEATARDAAIAVETTARINADATIQAEIDAISSGNTWRAGCIAATSDAGLIAAANGTALSSLLPFSDDDSPEMVIGDFSAGQYLLVKNGASSKVLSIYDDAGTLKVTDVGVAAIALHDAFVVQNDLPASPNENEVVAIYAYNGSDVVRVGTFAWNLASGINLGAFTPSAGTVVVGDTIQVALQKIVANLSVEITARQAADAVEQTARIAADLVLQGNINSEAATRLANDNTEITARIAGDNLEITARQAAIAQEVSDRNAAIAVEATARIAGDATNAAAILVEQTARIAADAAEVTARNAAIAVELTARNAAILVETNRALAAEAAIGLHFKESITLISGDITNQYVDLVHLSVPDSLSLSVDGVTQYEGEDYSLSTVGGVTRVTFINGLATGGSGALVASDILRFQYSY